MEYNEVKNGRKKDEVATQNFVMLSIIFSSIFILVLFFLDKYSLKEVDEMNTKLLLENLTFSELNITRPKAFDEKYKYIKLPNGVEIIMIESNNKKLSKNSAGIIVNSGAMNDIDTSGLAHFCEHMLFLGSKKYPNATLFNELITTNDGRFNGFTDKDTTTFIYDIKKEKFLESLDVFLNFFVKPLFKEEFIDKEVNAVNSEFEKNIHSEEKKFERLFQHFANKHHPYHNFSTGNKETLNNHSNSVTYLRDQVSQYFNKHYIGKNIKVVVFSNYEVENTEKLLLNNLIKVHNDEGYIHPKILYSHIPVFSNNEIPKMIFYKSRYKVLKIYYILNNIRKNVDVNIKMFLKTIFSVKYKNSLIENLIKNKLVFNFKLEFKDKNDVFSSVNLKFLLTEHGLRNSDLILNLLNNYIQVILNNVLSKKSYDMIKHRINHRFNRKAPIKNPYESMKKYTTNFFLYGKDNLLTSDSIMKRFDPNVLHKYLKNMTLHNSLIFLGSRTFKHFNETYVYKVLNNFTKDHDYNHSKFLDKKETNYKIRYHENKLDNDILWHLLKRTINSNLTFPDFTSNKSHKEKDSICKGLSIRECKKKYESKKLVPDLIYNKNNIEIWHLQDKSHLKKKFHLNLKLELKELDLKNQTHIPMMKFLIIYLNYFWQEQILKIKEKHSSSVRLRFSDNYKKKLKLFKWKDSKEMLKAENYQIDGLYITVNARSKEKFEKANIIKNIEEVLRYKMEKKEFIYLKEELLRNIEFYKSSNPTHQAFNWLYRLGFKYDINYFNLTSHIKNITLSKFNEFKGKVLKEFSVKALGYGNINKEKAEKFIQGIIKAINKDHKIIEKSKKNPQIFSHITDQIYEFSHYSYIFQKENLFKHSPDSSTLNVYFLGRHNYENLIKMQILCNIAGNTFFSYLRIKNQLGYTVKNKFIDIQDNLIFYIYVQGSKKSPTIVYKHIDKVLKLIKDKINSVNDKEFENIKNIVFNKIEKKNNHYHIKQKILWGYINKYEEIFDKKTVKNIVESITKTDILKFLENLLNHKLSIQVFNNGQKISHQIQNDNTKMITNIDFFRNQNSTFSKRSSNSKKSSRLYRKRFK